MDLPLILIPVLIASDSFTLLLIFMRMSVDFSSVN